MKDYCKLFNLDFWELKRFAQLPDYLIPGLPECPDLGQKVSLLQI